MGQSLYMTIDLPNNHISLGRTLKVCRAEEPGCGLRTSGWWSQDLRPGLGSPRHRSRECVGGHSFPAQG